MVVEALGCLLPIEKALRAGWNQKQFLHSDADDAMDTKLSEDDKDDLNVATLTKVIKSQHWWSYSCMLHEVHGLGEKFRLWPEACYCHGWLHDKDEKTQPVREHFATVRRNTQGLKANGDGIQYHPCKMSGNRAVELAMGVLSTCLEEMLQRCLCIKNGELCWYK